MRIFIITFGDHLDSLESTFLPMCITTPSLRSLYEGKVSGSVDLNMSFSGEPLFNLLHWLLWGTEASLLLNSSRQAVAEGDLTNAYHVRGGVGRGCWGGCSTPRWRASCASALLCMFIELCFTQAAPGCVVRVGPMQTSLWSPLAYPCLLLTARCLRFEQDFDASTALNTYIC